MSFTEVILIIFVGCSFCGFIGLCTLLVHEFTKHRRP